MRQARLELQNRFSSMHLSSTLSPGARPFWPQAAPSSTLMDEAAQNYSTRDGSDRGSPARGILPVGGICSNPHSTSEEEESATDTVASRRLLHRRWSSRRNQSSQSGSDSESTLTPRGRHKKKDGFSSKIHIPEFGDKKGHSSDVTGAFRQWARCITYY